MILQGSFTDMEYAQETVILTLKEESIKQDRLFSKKPTYFKTVNTAK